MKRAFLFALFFAEVAAIATPLHGERCPRRRLWAEPLRQPLSQRGVERYPVAPRRDRVVVQQITRTTGTLPAIAEQASRRSVANPQPVAEGVLPRALTSDAPPQMINPLAPLEYGSAWSLVTFTERDPYRTDNMNKNHLQPNGIRFLTLRPLW